MFAPLPPALVFSSAKNRLLTALLAAFVLLDLALTFWQNYQLPLDGDLVAIVLPAPWYRQVLHDPFGWSVLTQNVVYAGSNRFFAHASMELYWKSVPRLLQHFTSPISSLYAASALFMTATQALLLFGLAAYVRRASGRTGWAAPTTGSATSFWVAAALLTPLFQTVGFYTQMGITNRAVTYTFFYTLPLALLLGLLWPFFRAACRQEPLRPHPLQAALLLGLMVVLTFNGPVATASLAVLLLGLGLYWLRQHWQAAPPRPQLNPPGMAWLSGPASILLLLLAALCLYSLYIGRNNAENDPSHSLGELYRLLPQGIWRQLTWQPGLPVLLALLLLNAWLVRRWVPASLEGQRILFILHAVGLFAVGYVLLLPFGGYRSYRPLLLRNDSILPITLGVIFAYGASTYFLVEQLQGTAHRRYLTLVGLTAAFFTIADCRLTPREPNDCQRASLEQLARAPAPIVQIGPTCTVLSWTPIIDFHQSEYNAEMLRYWGVTTEKKLYFQQP